MAAPPRFSPALVMEMRAQGLSEDDALAALETCDGDGEKVGTLAQASCESPKSRAQLVRCRHSRFRRMLTRSRLGGWGVPGWNFR